MANQDVRSAHTRSYSTANAKSSHSSELYLGSKRTNHHNPLILPLGSSPIPPREPSMIELVAGERRPSIETGGLKNALAFKNKFLEATNTAVSAFPSVSAPPLRKVSTPNNTQSCYT